MDALAFSIPVPVGRVKSTLPIFPAPQRSALVCVAPNRSRGPAKRHRSRPGGGGGQSDPPGPRRPRLDLGEAERLQKVMSRLGFASRRKSEVLIAEGKVRVNGRVVKDQGVLVNSRKDQITVEGKKLVPQDRAIWMAVHKPRGYLSLPKEGGTRSVLDLVPRNKRTGLIPVGGIDEDYSGIVILTNERAHVQEQSSPQNRHVKEWIVDCEGVVNIDALGPLERGVHLKGDSTKTLPADVRIVGSEKVEVAIGEMKLLTRMEIRVREGRRHLIRRLFAHVGITVFRASRKCFGPILLGSLRRGDFRYLTPNEVKALTRGVKRSEKGK